MTGLGRRDLRIVATDSDVQMNVDDLRKRVAEDRLRGFLPFMVIGTAGTTAAGVIDPLPEIAAFCKSQSLWFHADAAWGGAAIISPALRHHLAGIELADSITCDAHKWLSVSMGCGMFFCRHRDCCRAGLLVPTSLTCLAKARGRGRHVRSAYTIPPSGRAALSDSSFSWRSRSTASQATQRCSSTRPAWPMSCATGSLQPAGASSTTRRCPLVCFTRDGLTPSILGR